MLKALFFTMIAGTLVAVSAGMPLSVAAGIAPLQEAGSMLLLGTALFAIASAVRRHGKSDRRP